MFSVSESKDNIFTWGVSSFQLRLSQRVEWPKNWNEAILQDSLHSVFQDTLLVHHKIILKYIQIITKKVYNIIHALLNIKYLQYTLKSQDFVQRIWHILVGKKCVLHRWRVFPNYYLKDRMRESYFLHFTSMNWKSTKLITYTNDWNKKQKQINKI